MKIKTIETKIILRALRNFLSRPEVENKTLTAVMPVDAKLGNLSGKEVEIPLTSVFQGMTNKLSFKEMAKVLDENNDVVIIFLEEFANELDGYSPAVDKSAVPFKDRERAVDDVASELEGDFSDSEDE
jgi:hypothetical protein